MKKIFSKISSDLNFPFYPKLIHFTSIDPACIMSVRNKLSTIQASKILHIVLKFQEGTDLIMLKETFTSGQNSFFLISV